MGCVYWILFKNIAKSNSIWIILDGESDLSLVTDFVFAINCTRVVGWVMCEPQKAGVLYPKNSWSSLVITGCTHQPPKGYIMMEKMGEGGCFHGSFQSTSGFLFEPTHSLSYIECINSLHNWIARTLHLGRDDGSI